MGAGGGALWLESTVSESTVSESICLWPNTSGYSVVETQSSLKGTLADSQAGLPPGLKAGSGSPTSALLGPMLPKVWASEELPEAGGSSDPA